MKKTLRIILSTIIVGLMGLTVSCTPDDDFTPDASLLIGTWQNGTEYYRYDATSTAYTLQNGSSVDVNGATWDTSDDVSEEEAQPFTWTLEGDNLLLVHIGYMGSRSPKSYTVTNLTSTTLAYSDNYGKNYTYTKVK